MLITERKIRANLETLNDELWAPDFEPALLPSQLHKLGFSRNSCIVIRMYPDSGRTWVVCLMDAKRQLLEVDLDLEAEDLSETRIENLSQDNFRRSQPAALLRIADEMLGQAQGAA